MTKLSFLLCGEGRSGGAEETDTSRALIREQGSRSAKAHGEGTTPDEKHTVGGVEWDWCGGGGIGLGLSIE